MFGYVTLLWNITFQVKYSIKKYQLIAHSWALAECILEVMPINYFFVMTKITFWAAQSYILTVDICRYKNLESLGDRQSSSSPANTMNLVLLNVSLHVLVIKSLQETQ